MRTFVLPSLHDRVFQSILPTLSPGIEVILGLEIGDGYYNIAIGYYNQILNLDIGIGYWILELDIGIGIGYWNWNWKLELKIGDWNWGFELEIQILQNAAYTLRLCGFCWDVIVLLKLAYWCLEGITFFSLHNSASQCRSNIIVQIPGLRFGPMINT